VTEEVVGHGDVVDRQAARTGDGRPQLDDAADPAGAEAADDAAEAADDGRPVDDAADDAAEAADDAALPGSLPGDDLTEAQLEALLFVAERPLGRRELATISGASSETIDARLGDLEVTLAERGVRLLVDGDRVALATAPEAGLLIGRYVGREPTRLSPATLETLAIVAYRQPVTKAGIERIRGVDAEYAIRSLLHRRLVVELGRADAPGRPNLYGTSVDFLERFGLLSLDELPVLDATIAERLAASDADRGADDEAPHDDADSGPNAARELDDPGLP
jgi:segregation and condensation protein B